MLWLLQLCLTLSATPPYVQLLGYYLIPALPPSTRFSIASIGIFVQLLPFVHSTTQFPSIGPLFCVHKVKFKNFFFLENSVDVLSNGAISIGLY